MNRKDLIKICEDAVVHHSEWQNRDSYSAQVQIQSIYEGLTAGLNYEISEEVDGKTINITFINVDADRVKSYGKFLEISTREEWFEENGYEDEMFDSDGISFYSEYTSGYMPTRKRLDEVDGGDWY